ncbi:MAG TPA: alpha/beta hydrolase [Gemmatimonadota bacterium]|nr:alpha/beta hydrolase [Gemmatimonadota bacterium]
MADVEARGLRFHVVRLGSGNPTVVFLHGLVMDNLSSWYFTVANPVARAADVILFDLRGHGKTERPRTGYTVDSLVADVDALLDALVPDGRAVELVGNSFGGLLALAYAIAHPERVRGLALVDANMTDDSWAGEITRAFALKGAERDEMIMKYAHRWAGRHSERKANRLIVNSHHLTRGTTLVDDLASSPPVTDEQLATIRCPVLALYGTDSELLDRGERLGRTIPNCEVRLFSGCTHLLLWEATEKLKEHIAEWIARPQERATAPSSSLL